MAPALPKRGADSGRRLRDVLCDLPPKSAAVPAKIRYGRGQSCGAAAAAAKKKKLVNRVIRSNSRVVGRVQCSAVGSGYNIEVSSMCLLPPIDSGGDDVMLFEEMKSL